ncbi:hypothetical protein BKA93DRAFT_753063 [Sparassis latifolia]
MYLSRANCKAIPFATRAAEMRMCIDGTFVSEDWKPVTVMIIAIQSGNYSLVVLTVEGETIFSAEPTACCDIEHDRARIAAHLMNSLQHQGLYQWNMADAHTRYQLRFRQTELLDSFLMHMPGTVSDDTTLRKEMESLGWVVLIDVVMYPTRTLYDHFSESSNCGIHLRRRNVSYTNQDGSFVLSENPNIRSMRAGCLTLSREQIEDQRKVSLEESGFRTQICSTS